MVALSSSTVARSGMSMVAWALWALLFICGLTHGYTKPNNKYGGEGLAEEDTINYVSGDEVVIDQLEDFLQSRRHLDDQPSPPYLPQQARTSPPYLPQQGVNGKIHFAVSPKDQRYYLPVSSLRPVEPPEQVEEEEEGLRLLPQDLGLQPQQVYPGEFFQYQDEEQQDPSQYQPQYRYEPRRPQEQDQYQPQFLPRLPYSRYPEEAVYDVRRLDPRLMGAEGEREEMEEENTGREEIKRLMVDENDDYNVDKNTKTAEEAETTVAPQKVATSQPEAVNYMHLRHSPSEAKESSYAIHDANQQQQPHLSDLYFTAVVAGCTAVAVCGVIGAGICWYR
ncbi:involucrin-like isoform X1 [Homarus americanus]|uniref:involucrin-like isoform X1 n=1 Tax=Homarus americanus TaxID=6706 RepID=UPI001C47EA09|nr:involucrin-like isoform X1 [Homarus americanus]